MSTECLIKFFQLRYTRTRATDTHTPHVVYWNKLSSAQCADNIGKTYWKKAMVENDVVREGKITVSKIDKTPRVGYRGGVYNAFSQAISHNLL